MKLATKTSEPWLFGAIDASSIACFRVFFGGLMVWKAIELWAKIETYYLHTHLFPYEHLEFIAPFPEPWIQTVFATMAISAAFLSIGLLYRLAALLLFLSYGYVFLLDQTTYTDYDYLCLIFCAFFLVTRAHAAISIDLLIREGRFFSRVPHWHQLIFRTQMFIVYFYAGMAKFSSDWFHGEPTREILRNKIHDLPFAEILSSEAAIGIFSYGAVLFDLSIGFLLLNRRTRLVGVAVLCSFQWIYYWTFPGSAFPLLAVGAAILFFSPDAPRKILEAIVGPDAASKDIHFMRRGTVIALIVLGVSLQILTPLRHFLIPGNVNWTSEGERFAWRGKFNAKDGAFRIFAFNPESGKREVIATSNYMTKQQASFMSIRPHLARQFARFLGDEQREYGIQNPVVQIEAVASLNGRPYQYLVYPDANLGAIETGEKYIVPLDRGQPIGHYPQTQAEWYEAVQRVLNPQ